MKMTLELPVYAGQTLIGWFPDVVVDVDFNRHGQMFRVMVSAWSDDAPPLKIHGLSDCEMSSTIWRMVEERIESGAHDSEIAEYVAEMKEAEREYARELRSDYYAASAV